jgi:hypothetical protein
MIIFPQHLLHEVVSKKSGHEQMRLFTGWRLTIGNEVFHKDDTISAIAELGIPTLASGQLPPMFSTHHATALKQKSFNWLGSDAGPSGTLKEWWDTSFDQNVKNKHANEPARYIDPLTKYPIDYTRYEYDDSDKNIMLNLHTL